MPPAMAMDPATSGYGSHSGHLRPHHPAMDAVMNETHAHDLCAPKIRNTVKSNLLMC